MRKMKMFDLNLAETVGRFYLMMAVVLILGFLGHMTLAALVGYVVALSFILGVSYRKTTKKAAEKGMRRIDPMQKETTLKKAA